MAYVKNIWVDQDVERPKTYEVTNNQDGSITLTDSFGLVTELGTPVNEVNMNHIEDGIDGCAIRKHNLTETFNLGEWVLGGTGVDEGIYKSLIANNVNNAITDDTKWEKISIGADKDLSNLTTTGEKHFLNKKQITNCILETPNNWMTYSGSQVTIKAGTKYLVPNGRNADGTLNNAEVTIQSDVVFTNTGQYDGTICILGFADGDLWSWGSVTSMGYYRNSSEFPTPATGFYWLAFSEEDNKWYITDNGSAYTQSLICPLGTAKITTDSSIQAINPFKPVHLLTIGNREEISGWGMPSYTYVDWALGASGATYLSPANGWFCVAKKATGAQYLDIIYLDNNNNTMFINSNNAKNSSDTVRIITPVLKGQVIQINYILGGATEYFKFVCAQGSESEVL